MVYVFVYRVTAIRARQCGFAFPVMLVTAIFAGAASIISVEQSYITIEMVPQTVKEGETFFITVKATAHTAVNAIDVVIQYPEHQIEVIGVDTGESVITLWTQAPYAENGSVYLRGGTFGQGFIGEHTIAKIRAKAIEAGSAYVTTDSVKFVAGDGEGTEVPVTDGSTNQAKIYISNEDGSIVGTASVKIITDVDGDGDVDITDISVFMSAWFNKSTIFDFNGDGRMTFRDFSIILADSFLN